MLLLVASPLWTHGLTHVSILENQGKKCLGRHGRPSGDRQTDSTSMQPCLRQRVFSGWEANDCTAGRSVKLGVDSGAKTSWKGRPPSAAALAAALAAASAAAFLWETESVLPVCAAHFTIAMQAGRRVASSSVATWLELRMGFPSDFRNFLCLHKAPKSCTTPNA